MSSYHHHTIFVDVTSVQFVFIMYPHQVKTHFCGFSVVYFVTLHIGK